MTDEIINNLLKETLLYIYAYLFVNLLDTSRKAVFFLLRNFTYFIIVISQCKNRDLLKG